MALEAFLQVVEKMILKGSLVSVFQEATRAGGAFVPLGWPQHCLHCGRGRAPSRPFLGGFHYVWLSDVFQSISGHGNTFHTLKPGKLRQEDSKFKTSLYNIISWTPVSN